jgi:ferredoxin
LIYCEHFYFKNRRFQMYVIDKEACIACGACEGTCPVSAIAAADGKYEISDACIDCGACAGVCPVECITAQ